MSQVFHADFAEKKADSRGNSSDDPLSAQISIFSAQICVNLLSFVLVFLTFKRGHDPVKITIIDCL
jgi:hypothetical protein